MIWNSTEGDIQYDVNGMYWALELFTKLEVCIRHAFQIANEEIVKLGYGQLTRQTFKYNIHGKQFIALCIGIATFDMLNC